MSLGIICMSCYIFSHIYVLRKRETSQGEFDWVISNFMTTARFFQMEVRYLLGEKKFEKKNMICILWPTIQEGTSHISYLFEDPYFLMLMGTHHTKFKKYGRKYETVLSLRIFWFVGNMG